MRLFVTIPLSRSVIGQLSKVIHDFQSSNSGVKWVNPNNIHITLKFLGETNELLVPNINKAITRVARKFDPSSATIDILGGFPNLHKARVYWAGFSQPPEILENIASEIDNEMSQLGFDKEKRPFKSHLTIGRVKDSRAIGSLPDKIKNYQITPQSIEFKQIILFKSTLTPRGPIYDKLFTADLKIIETFS